MTRQLRNFEVAGQLTEQGYRVTKSWTDSGDAGVLVVADGDVAPAPPSTVGLVPTGAVMPFAGSSAPASWLICDGTSVSTATYAALFAVIGYTYGGSGGSFTLPNLNGRVPVGRDTAQTEFDVLGETGGAKTHTLTSAEMPSHTHVQNAHTHVQNSHNHIQDAHKHDLTVGIVTPSATGTSIASPVPNGSTYGFSYMTAPAANGMSNFTATNQAATAVNQNATAVNQSTGGDGAHNNLQPYLVLNYIIKT